MKFTADLAPYKILTNASVKEAMELIDSNKSGIALVVDPNQKLLGTITDGDIRRFILAGKSFELKCTEVMNVNPILCSSKLGLQAIKQLMQENILRQIPIVDEQGRLQDLALYNHVFKLAERDNFNVVIMAGGEGKRLRPITESIPKPMVEVGGKPMLERIIENLVSYGVKEIMLAVNYKAHIIEEHFGNGERFGANITYIREEKKLGTAGALSLIPSFMELSSPLIVMNGDVITKVNFEGLIDFHRKHRFSMCVAASEYNINIPLGVLELANHYVLGVEEKPTKKFLCNAGIYTLDRETLRLIPNNEFYNMTDLLQRVVQEGLPVGAFPIHEYWVDVGRMDDLERARDKLK